MYINKAQLESRLKGQSDLSIKTPHIRKAPGTKHLSHEEKVLIGSLAQTDSQANVARAFNVSESTVSNISRGLDASKRQDSELSKDISKAKEEISSKALHVLMTSLGVVDSKIKNTRGASEASNVAKNMAIIADRLSPSIERNQNNGPKILININGPKVKDESDYEVVEVNPV